MRSRPLEPFDVLAILLVVAGGGMALEPAAAAQGLPTGYLVWSQGKAGDPGSRKIVRLTLPDESDPLALTSGEDVECQISPDGRWVAYAKAKLPGGSDYHNPKLWKIYLVSIHGMGEGRGEIKIDDDGTWPSWGGPDLLYYNQADGTHTKIVRVRIDFYGRVLEREILFETRTAFGAFREINECFVAPDASWFAARTRGGSAVNGVGAYTFAPPEHQMLARAGSIGCMPYVAPSSEWGLIAGAGEGIRWGHAPQLATRQTDQQLVPPLSSGHNAYHPGVSTDEKWVMASMGLTDQDHNGGHYQLYLYALDRAAMTVGPGALVAGEGFNGWPHLWVGEPGPPPPPEPRVLDFYPSSYTVSPAEAVTLSWDTVQADAVTLDGQRVEPQGSQEVAPASTTRYLLEAASSEVPGKAASASCEITVNATPQAVVVARFAAEPAVIEQGQSATLSWEVQNPTTLDLDGERVAPRDTLEASPLKTTTYVLSAKGHQGPAVAEVTVKVEAISSGLLPDRGGFVCGLGQAAGAPALLVLLLCGALWVARRRQRCPRR